MTLKTILLIALFAFPCRILLAEESIDEGKQLFTNYCVACHGVSGGMDMSKRLAPPMIAVKMRYIKANADEQSFVRAIADWVTKPEEDRSLMRGAVRRFQLMPAMPIPREDIEKIASYVFKGDIDKPKGFEQHFKKQHDKGNGKRKN